MARVKVDKSKVQWESEDYNQLPTVLNRLSETIRGLVSGKKIEAKPIDCTLNVAPEGADQKLVGSAYLKISKVLDSTALDSILAEIKNAGSDAVVEIWNGYARGLVLARLESSFGDVSKAIAEGVAALVANGFEPDEAREMVIARRQKKGLRIE